MKHASGLSCYRVVEPLGDDADHQDRRGHRIPSTLAKIDLRNHFLRDMHGTFYSSRSFNQAARLIRQALDRYRDSGWRRDRAEVSCPERLAGRAQAFCWHILKAIDHVPCERTIWNALAAIRFKPKRPD